MLYSLLSSVISEKYILLLGAMFAFFGTALATGKLHPLLPRDAGRAFAHEGKLSAGKPRGAGIIFVIAFVLATAFFAPMNLEFGVYLLMLLACMMTGFLDDAAKNPWGEYKKGFLDLVIAVLVTVNFLYHNGSDVNMALLHLNIRVHPVLYAILAVILIWASVNVTNCSDGVDGLSGSLTITTMLTMYVVLQKLGVGLPFAPQLIFFVMALLGYLWFNATPSILMMGDAGSRTMGLMIAIACLISRDPVLFVLVAFVLIMDGGLGLLKVALLRFLKIHILKNIRTPLHDQVRKVMGWSNTQCVFRFVIIQAVIGAMVIYLL